jgi:hypothetical protein
MAVDGQLGLRQFDIEDDFSRGVRRRRHVLHGQAFRGLSRRYKTLSSSPTSEEYKLERLSQESIFSIICRKGQEPRVHY